MDALTRDIARGDQAFDEGAFTRLLHWLDEGHDSRGQTYLETRRRLVTYFERRHRPAADELADETLNRIGRTLEQSGSIAVTPPARYCYVVARFVLLEDVRRGQRSVPFDEARDSATASFRHDELDDPTAQQDQYIEHLDSCLVKLKPEQRELIVEYYRDAKRQRIDRRQRLAARLGISMNALGIRAHRIRAALELCVHDCSRTM